MEGNNALDLSNHHDYKAENIVLHSVVLFFLTVAVAVRIYTRQWIKNFMSYDDYFILISWALSITFSALFMADNVQGFGKHMWDIPPVRLYHVLKILYVAQLIYIIMLVTIKLSILLTYERIFKLNRSGRILVWFGIIALTIFYIVQFFLSLFYCTPIAKTWYPLAEGHCAPYSAHVVLPWASGIFNTVSDFYILILPMPFIWRINMAWRRKARLLAVFGLGLFTCISSIMRLVITIQHIADPDQTWIFAKYLHWLVLEVNVGLICGCALAFPAFFDSSNPGSLGSFISKLRSQTSIGTRSNSEETLPTHHNCGDNSLKGSNGKLSNEAE